MSKIITKKRLDELVSENFELTIHEAEMQIRSGNVTVNSEKVFLPSLKYQQDSKLQLLNQKDFVSRGAYKLLKALETFKIDPKNFICLDIGSSTGGFVDVLLKHKASKVYAVDVGTNQLDYKLRTNNKVICYEQTNLKDLTIDMFNEQLNLITCDVSFISLKHVFEVSKDLVTKDTPIIVLIKPQFEAASKYVSEGGYVEIKYHDFIINRVKEYAFENDFEFINITKSPITGSKSKNIEYLAIFKRK